jgi:basic membrane protein A
MLKRVDNAVFLTAKAVAEGDKSGGFKTFDLKSDGVGYATSGGYLDDIVSQLEELKAKVISGEIVVPTAP